MDSLNSEKNRRVDVVINAGDGLLRMDRCRNRFGICETRHSVSGRYRIVAINEGAMIKN